MTRGTGWVTRDGDRWSYHLARILKSPNTWQGRHWRVKDRDTREWQVALAWAVWLSSCHGEPPPQATGRVRVTVTRFVPTRRHFIRDEDNLRFCTKPLNDALTRLGWIRDDSRRWLEQPLPSQRVSVDHRHWTVVTIEPIAGVEAMAEKGGRG